MPLTLRVHTDPVSIIQLSATDTVPDWAMTGPFWSVTRRDDELSVITSAPIPSDISSPVSGPWAVLEVVGPLDLAMIGVMAGMTEALASSGINVLTIGTYDTDLLLVPVERGNEAMKALLNAGYEVADAL